MKWSEKVKRRRLERLEKQLEKEKSERRDEMNRLARRRQEELQRFYKQQQMFKLKEESSNTEGSEETIEPRPFTGPEDLYNHKEDQP